MTNKADKEDLFDKLTWEEKLKAIREDFQAPHQHKFTIAVETDLIESHTNTSKTVTQVVKVLRCSCGEETER